MQEVCRDGEINAHEGENVEEVGLSRSNKS